jgi:hypothetical protein
VKPLVPDVEALLTAYLTPVVEGLGSEVVDQTPDDTNGSWVLLTLLDDPADPVADHAVRAMVQLDCYASKGADDPHAEASLLRRTVRAAIADIENADHEGAVVSGAAINGSLRLPDETFAPPRERYVLTATVFCHS